MLNVTKFALIVQICKEYITKNGVNYNGIISHAQGHTTDFGYIDYAWK